MPKVRFGLYVGINGRCFDVASLNFPLSRAFLPPEPHQLAFAYLTFSGQSPPLPSAYPPAPIFSSSGRTRTLQLSQSRKKPLPSYRH